MQYFAFGIPSGLEWVAILVVVAILFGLGKLPKALGQMGKGMKAFKDGMRGADEEGAEDQIDVTPDDDAPALEVAQIEEANEVAPPPSPSIHDAITTPSTSSEDAAPADPAPSTDLHDAVTEPASEEIRDNE